MIRHHLKSKTARCIDFFGIVFSICSIGHSIQCTTEQLNRYSKIKWKLNRTLMLYCHILPIVYFWIRFDSYLNWGCLQPEGYLIRHTVNMHTDTYIHIHTHLHICNVTNNIPMVSESVSNQSGHAVLMVGGITFFTVLEVRPSFTLGFQHYQQFGNSQLAQLAKCLHSPLC